MTDAAVLRYAALDVGDKTVGVAVSDALGLTAQGITTVLRQDDAADFKKLKDMFAEYGINGVVVGLPKNMDGSEGERCRIVREFTAALSAYMPQMTFCFQDERLSTVAAERTLKEAAVRRKKRKKVVDKMAAVIILQAYLDKLNFKKNNEVTDDGERDF